jgi:hypothetical protein
VSTASMPPGQFHEPDQFPPPPPDRDQRPGGSRLASLLAGSALVVALIAVGVSLVALSRTADPAPAGATGAPTQPSVTTDVGPTGATPTDTLPTDDTATTDPSQEPTSEPTDGPDPSGSFTVAYQSEPLRLQPSTQRYIDLDEPSGNAASSAAELTYSGYTGDYKLVFRDLALASVNSPAATANDCAQQLRRAPIDTAFAPSKGQLVCVLTDREAADDQGIRQKIVLLRVDSIAQDGTLNLTLTAWTVPR